MKNKRSHETMANQRPSASILATRQPELLHSNAWAAAPVNWSSASSHNVFNRRTGTKTTTTPVQPGSKAPKYPPG